MRFRHYRAIKVGGGDVPHGDYLRSELALPSDSPSNLVTTTHSYYLDTILKFSLLDGCKRNLKNNLVISGQYEDFRNFLITTFDDSYDIVEFDSHNETQCFIVNSDKKVFARISGENGLDRVNIVINGELSSICDLENKILKKFPIYDKQTIDWVYTVDGDTIEVPVIERPMPTSEMYPFLGNESLESYFQRYYESSSSILVLIGPPGTGKTTFISSLIRYKKMKALVSYDMNILTRDSLFATFIAEKYGALILEDADSFLHSRQDGNTMMHRFLNVGDGLVSARNKKIIFSTNLPNLDTIDPAIIRPGRCFDVIKFDYLTQNQAENIAAQRNIKIGKQDKWTIAEIFHGINTNQHTVDNQKRMVGFNRG